jgi:hypothetical protein
MIVARPSTYGRYAYKRQWEETTLHRYRITGTHTQTHTTHCLLT